MFDGAALSKEVCEMCGGAFDCMGKGLRVCWCLKAKVSRERLSEIKKGARSCVCAKCLR